MIKLHPDEKIVAEIRRHWLVLFGQSFPLIFIALLPAGLWLLILAFADPVLLLRLEGLFMFFAALWLLFLWIAFFTIWTNHYLDVLLITDKRIIDIEQEGFFHRELSECRLDNIQDITVEVHGLVATALKFGTLHIQTAAEAIQFNMVNVPHPYQTKELISKLHDEAVRKNREGELVR